MSANTSQLTITLTSSQAASIDAWLQKCGFDSTRLTAPDVLVAFGAQLDEARWIGRWLREEARFIVDQAAAATIVDAISQAQKLVRPSDNEELALRSLTVKLEEVARSGAPQLVCSALLAYSAPKSEV